MTLKPLGFRSLCGTRPRHNAVGLFLGRAGRVVYDANKPLAAIQISRSCGGGTIDGIRIRKMLQQRNRRHWGGHPQKESKTLDRRPSKSTGDRVETEGRTTGRTMRVVRRQPCGAEPRRAYGEKRERTVSEPSAGNTSIGSADAAAAVTPSSFSVSSSRAPTERSKHSAPECQPRGSRSYIRRLPQMPILSCLVGTFPA